MSKAEYFALHFYDSQGEDTTISRAKYAVFAYKPKGKEKQEPKWEIFEFPKITAKAFDKEVLLLLRFDEINQKKVVDRRVDYGSFDEYNRQTDIFERIGEDLVEQLDEEGEEDLADDLEREFIDFLVARDSAKEYYKTIFPGAPSFADPKTIHSANLKTAAEVQNIYYELNKDFPIEDPSYDEFVEFAKQQFRQAMIEILKDERTIRGADMFIFRINYAYDAYGQENIDTIPLPRLEVDEETDEEIVDLILGQFDKFADDNRAEFEKYLNRDSRSNFKAVGFTFENLYWAEGS